MAVGGARRKSAQVRQAAGSFGDTQGRVIQPLSGGRRQEHQQRFARHSEFRMKVTAHPTTCTGTSRLRNIFYSLLS